MAVLKVDSVQLAFDLRKILQDVYLECKQGEVVGLLGRNGSGKSSLLKIIFGRLTPGYKYVSIDNEFVKKGYINNKIAYLPQHNYLPRGISIKTLATKIVSEQYWDEFNNQSIYKNHAHKKPEELSGGELRQLEMLMILYSKADFILLDEPFTHVTPIQCEYFKTIIKTVSKTKGIIITDHQYQNVLDVSDRIILLTEGSTKPITNIDELAVYRYISGT
ncbi:ATP-binding cassette domain-containing protein [Mucilaginibacter auburnensis]|uniref:ABC-type lipopolysaccharide export system ATPase subunit n=1 Tax=Mucilaginibacter auburnensis TaxID=1457233 RepID=A0A2H9VMM1_9SPHI|nr:ATP-binding cassette domain-containing protein [Mucilaginibacter auburnensis]PJJ79578.1 ABC-type lipopolysaccharide export system ATPase subunit [Mucilaginibacter auburnensis]